MAEKEERVTIPLGSSSRPESKGIHAHKHRIKAPLLLFILIVLGVLIFGASLFYLQNKVYIAQTLGEEATPTFSIDHLLLKVLLKEGEFAEQEIRIMNIADSAQEFTLTHDGLHGIVSLDSPKFSLDPGQTKVVRASFRSRNEAEGIEQQPGVYIGNLVVESSSSHQEIPIVVEIESANVLFDANLNPVSLDRNVERGDDFVVEVRLFNLQSIDAENVDMRYAVKDIHGSTLITESETVVVKTQASFFKTTSIPTNLAAGTYVFGTEASVGNSIGTSSYLFEVIDSSRQALGVMDLVDFCKSDPLCSGLSIALIILLIALAAYFYLFLGAYLYEKLGSAITGKKREPQIIVQTVKQKGWLASLLEERRKRRLENERLKLLARERQQKSEQARKELALKEERQKEELRLLDEKQKAKEELSRKREEARLLALSEKRAAEEERSQREEERKLRAEQVRLKAAEEKKALREEEKRRAQEIEEAQREVSQKQEDARLRKEEESKRSQEEREKKKEESRQKRLEEEKQAREERARKEEEKELRAQELREKSAQERRRHEQEKGLKEEELRLVRMKWKQEDDAAQRKMEQERLAIQKRRQRIEMLKLMFFGKKDDDGKIKAQSTRKVVSLDKEIDGAMEALKVENLKKARKRYEGIIKEYHSFSLAEKKAVYPRITSLYKKIVEQENKFHQHSKDEQQSQESERKKLEQEKEEHKEMIRQQREEDLARREEEEKLRKETLRQQKEEHRKIIEEERESHKQTLALQKEELKAKKAELTDEAREERLQRQEENLAKKKQDAGEEEKHLQKLEEERDSILAHLSKFWEEFNSLISSLSTQEEEANKRRIEVRSAEAQLAHEIERKKALDESSRDHEKARLVKGAEIEAQWVALRAQLRGAGKKERAKSLKDFKARKHVWEKSSVAQKQQDLIDIKAIKDGIRDAEKHRKEMLSALASSERLERQTREKIGRAQTHIVELQQRRISIENSLLLQKKKVSQMKGGFGSIGVMFMPSRYKPSAKDGLMTHPEVPEKKEIVAQDPIQESFIPQSKEEVQESVVEEEHTDIPITENFKELGEDIEEKPQASTRQPFAIESSSSIISKESVAEVKVAPDREEIAETTKRNAPYKKYANAIAEAEKHLLKKRLQAAKKAYLSARELYMKLEYHERTEAYDGLNALYQKLAGKK